MERIWRSGTPDDGSIHCLGNGRLVAYGQGPDLIQVFGPPYSAPAFYRLALDMTAGIEVRSVRTSGSALWSHVICDAGQEIGRMVDFVDAELAVFVRRIAAGSPLRFRLAADRGVRLSENSDLLANAAGGWLLLAPTGLPIYHTYPFPTPIFHQVAWQGAMRVDESGGELAITCAPGVGTLYLVGGPSYPEAIETAERALAVGPERLEERTRAWWTSYSRAHSNLNETVHADTPQRPALLDASDSVAVLIKAQQSAEGGILAGYPYHLAYVRDQYGTARGLLKLGHTAEARAILEFYWRIWQRHGRIHNAQAMGVDGVFHVHENDEVEITGYLIRQAFDLQDGTGDAGFTDTIAPMLEWAWMAQGKHLVGGMLPFNGDETYVAGGILPRSTLDDGSAEATLLFVESGRRLVEWAASSRRWQTERLAEARRVLDEVAGTYRANFWRAGRLITNNPRRRALAPLPRFRHGVCERRESAACRPGVQWTERDAAGRMQCPECLAKGPLSRAEPTEYALQSVGLMPLYLEAGLMGSADLRPVVEDILLQYVETGRLPSRPDDPAGRTVGYDYGLLLYALAEIGHESAGVLYKKTLSLLDPAGAWVEYYEQHQPISTRCRPWESGINIEAALHWAGKQGVDTRKEAI